MKPLFRPLVSVIIPTYNCSGEFLIEAIESALNQTYSPLEVIVVDDGSTNDTAAIVARYGDRVRYVYKENGGTPSARNVGMSYAKGELVSLLDHDDRWLPTKIEKQVPYFEQVDVGLVHGGARFFRTESGEITGESLPAPVLSFHDLVAWCPVCCGTTMFRKSVVDDLGGFDESLRGTDDWDLWIRIAQTHKVLGHDEILSEIRLHDKNQGNDSDTMFPHVMAVIEKTSHIHSNCAACERALRSARNQARREYYARLSGFSGQAFQRGEYLRALQIKFRGLQRDPAALLRLPLRTVQKIREFASKRAVQ
ncbi:Glycosyl transferase family 2 [Abditibacterium utsteinense]|uniref:Glycosyl transferase family 2 n=1 Tax=Abditibacterium utsteinense TaxID=1960156 RepID=A0A2S8SSB0_9BACT|nr:glycosyltransferase [Abditibacterium utsteinense]PQV63691.1 Glycosyl transferase family 2 [Abditibacterium utsteinense]